MARIKYCNPATSYGSTGEDRLACLKTTVRRTRDSSNWSSLRSAHPANNFLPVRLSVEEFLTVLERILLVLVWLLPAPLVAQSVDPIVTEEQVEKLPFNITMDREP